MKIKMDQHLISLNIIKINQKIFNKKNSGNISDISKSNSEDISRNCDGNSSSDSNESVPSQKYKEPKTNVKGSWYKKRDR